MDLGLTVRALSERRAVLAIRGRLNAIPALATATPSATRGQFLIGAAVSAATVLQQGEARSFLQRLFDVIAPPRDFAAHAGCARSSLR